MSDILTVSGLNLYVKTLLESDRNLRSITLRGEISNLRADRRSGHIYLVLKDERSSISAVMFSSSAERLKFIPDDGMKVIVKGRISLYEAAGKYQIYVSEMLPEGEGELSLAFERLKNKLAAEGIFDERHKKALPLYPKRIGVVTSPQGKAIEDITQTLKRRYPVGEIILCPAAVQGEGAGRQLAEGIRRFDRLKCVDVIIIGRGGGSAEELWAFNDEELARAVYDCEIPVVSAVGHETDFTICDLAADVRASTPTAGAELVAGEMSSMLSTLAYSHRRICELMRSRLRHERQRLDIIKNARVLRSPLELVSLRKNELDVLNSRLLSVYSARLSKGRHDIALISAKLDALSPLKVLGRGYSIAKKQNNVLRSVKSVKAEDNIELILQDGELKCSVLEIKEKKHEQD